MKNIFIIFLLIFVSLAAYGKDNNYIAIKGGYDYSFQKEKGYTFSGQYYPSHKFYEADNTVLGISVGHKFNNLFRTELDYKHKIDNDVRGNNIRDAFGYPVRDKFTEHSLLINTFLHPFSYRLISPYFGLGCGWAWSNYAHIVKQNNFSYAAYLGADYNIYTNLILDLSISYSNTLSDRKGLKNIHSVSGTIGIRYMF